jgi:uncharacterized protein (DUF1778 family)
MATPNDRLKADMSVTVRIPRQVKDLIDTAASTSGKSFSAFMIESARDRASDLLLDQTLFHLAPAEAEEFARLLDSPPPPTEALKALMAGTGPWAK